MGDDLILQEFDPEEGYLGREIRAKVTYILHEHEGLKPGYVVMSLEVKKYNHLSEEAIKAFNNRMNENPKKTRLKALIQKVNNPSLMENLTRLELVYKIVDKSRDSIIYSERNTVDLSLTNLFLQTNEGRLSEDVRTLFRGCIEVFGQHEFRLEDLTEIQILLAMQMQNLSRVSDE